MLVEYCEFGALNSYLKNTDVHEQEKLRIAYDTAMGMAYLADRHFVHRDLAARNILLSSEKRAKISDFGMSRDMEHKEYYTARSGQLPVRWTAPEALEHKRFTSASDCWSYGVTLYEIWTKAELPYKGFTNQKVWMMVLTDYRLPCPEDCPEFVHELMLACWHADPNERPPFAHLALQLRSVLQLPVDKHHLGMSVADAYVPLECEDGHIATAADVIEPQWYVEEKKNRSATPAAAAGNLYDLGNMPEDENAYLQPVKENPNYESELPPSVPGRAAASTDSLYLEPVKQPAEENLYDMAGAAANTPAAIPAAQRAGQENIYDHASSDMAIYDNKAQFEAEEEDAPRPLPAGNLYDVSEPIPRSPAANTAAAAASSNLYMEDPADPDEPMARAKAPTLPPPRHNPPSASMVNQNLYMEDMDAEQPQSAEQRREMMARIDATREIVAAAQTDEELRTFLESDHTSVEAADAAAAAAAAPSPSPADAVPEYLTVEPSIRRRTQYETIPTLPKNHQYETIDGSNSGQKKK